MGRSLAPFQGTMESNKDSAVPRCCTIGYHFSSLRDWKTNNKIALSSERDYGETSHIASSTRNQ